MVVGFMFYKFGDVLVFCCVFFFGGGYFESVVVFSFFVGCD